MYRDQRVEINVDSHWLSIRCTLTYYSFSIFDVAKCVGSQTPRSSRNNPGICPIAIYSTKDQSTEEESLKRMSHKMSHVMSNVMILDAIEFDDDQSYFRFKTVDAHRNQVKPVNTIFIREFTIYTI